MSDLIRRIVSGNKTRFKDPELKVELDLVYITDQIIIMGYPASGVEGLYRNRRQDAKRFLEHRHGTNYWIFNLCPLKENSYSPDYFHGRVSRYPFPDHHAPPLAVLPLAAREIAQWLEESAEHVAVLHCKAGKGRSGTIACAYLLTLDSAPSPPQMQRSYSKKDQAVARARRVMQSVETEEMSEEVFDDEPQGIPEGGEGALTTPTRYKRMSTPLPSSPGSPTARPARPSHSRSNTLEDVLALHTSRRMKPPSSPKAKTHQGVSIPSQRRWLYYWSILLAKEGPLNFWTPSAKQNPRKVRLDQITVRMRELSSVTKNVVKFTNNILEKAQGSKLKFAPKGRSHIWASVGRYDDELVDFLEGWERATRDPSDIGEGKRSAAHLGDQELSALYREGKWDRTKMINSFARFASEDGMFSREESPEGEPIVRHAMRPLSEADWSKVEEEIKNDNGGPQTSAAPAPSTASSVVNLLDSTGVDKSGGIVLNAEREFRVKLYIGQIFMGWFWLIPVFHLDFERTPTLQPSQLILTKKEIDFPLGAGSSIIDVTIDWSPLPLARL